MVRRAYIALFLSGTLCIQASLVGAAEQLAYSAKDIPAVLALHEAEKQRQFALIRDMFRTTLTKGQISILCSSAETPDVSRFIKIVQIIQSKHPSLSSWRPVDFLFFVTCDYSGSVSDNPEEIAQETTIMRTNLASNFSNDDGSIGDFTLFVIGKANPYVFENDPQGVSLAEFVERRQAYARQENNKYLVSYYERVRLAIQHRSSFKVEPQ